MGGVTAQTAKQKEGDVSKNEAFEQIDLSLDLLVGILIFTEIRKGRVVGAEGMGK